MKNLNEQIGRFKQLLNAEHGIIKPYKIVKEDSDLNSFDDEEEYREGEKKYGEKWALEERLQDLLDDAYNFLEEEGLEHSDIISMDELEIANELRHMGEDNRADEIEELYYAIDMDEDEPIDSIGGHSVRDMKNAFNNVMKKNQKK